MQGQNNMLRDFSQDGHLVDLNSEDARFEALFPAGQGIDEWEPLNSSGRRKDLSELAAAIAGMQNSAEKPSQAEGTVELTSPPEMEPQPLASIPLDQHETMLEDLQKHHKDALDEQQQLHDMQILDFLKTIENRLSDEVTERLEAKLALVISEIAEEKLSREIMDELIEEVGGILRKETVSNVTVQGPPKLMDRIKTAFSADKHKLEFEENDALDLVVGTDDKILTTRISDWAKRFREALSA